MFESTSNQDKKRYRILWDQIGLFPSIQLKIGIKRKVFPLTKQYTKKRDTLYYVNNFIELKGKWDNSPGFGSLLSLKIKNVSDSSIRITRLVFPTENGLDNFLKGFKPSDISFLRNGYQSWSTARSYKLKDKPLRPWLQLVSLASSNMANLPSNTAGNLSSEMYSIICDLSSHESFLVGQSTPFNQFFYIRLKFYRTGFKMNHIELVYDFGRKMLEKGETIQLDGIIMAQGETSGLLLKYFNYIKNKHKIKEHEKNFKGWSSWYYYYNKITPNIIYRNLLKIKEEKLDIDYIQIDDGYQKNVGDWLDLTHNFKGQMKKITDTIKDNGFIPGIWIAPFIADKKSELISIHPEYILKDQYGKPLVCGYNPSWKGLFYYALDITYPRFEEYLRKVIRTIVHEWGFEYLKLDFLFGGCLRGGTHHNLALTRTEVLKYGMKVIREEAGSNVILAGCGMPISSGIGMVDLMRVGPDTAPYWKKISGTILHTGAMLGLRNSLRNNMVRCTMSKSLWINDPDCLMIRKKKTKLTSHQRKSQINTIILLGSSLFLSDNMLELSKEIIDEIKTIISLNDKCFHGKCIALDLMEKALPEILYNTAGYIGIFNFKNRTLTKEIELNRYELTKSIKKLQDIWNNEIIEVNKEGIFRLDKMHPYSSRLFKVMI